MSAKDQSISFQWWCYSIITCKVRDESRWALVIATLKRVLINTSIDVRWCFLNSIFLTLLQNLQLTLSKQVTIKKAVQLDVATSRELCPDTRNFISVIININLVPSIWTKLLLCYPLAVGQEKDDFEARMEGVARIVWTTFELRYIVDGGNLFRAMCMQDFGKGFSYKFPFLGILNLRSAGAEHSIQFHHKLNNPVEIPKVVCVPRGWKIISVSTPLNKSSHVYQFYKHQNSIDTFQ